MNSLQNDCTYVVEGRGIVCQKPGEDCRWLHDPKVHQHCIDSSMDCYLHEYQPPQEPAYYSMDLDADNVADLAQSMAATLSPLMHGDVDLIGIVSESEGGIIAYALGQEHADLLINALRLASQVDDMRGKAP